MEECFAGFHGTGSWVKTLRVCHGAMRYMGCFELVSLMCMNRTSGVGRHTCVIPEAPGLEPWGVVTHCTRDPYTTPVLRPIIIPASFSRSRCSLLSFYLVFVMYTWRVYVRLAYRIEVQHKGRSSPWIIARYLLPQGLCTPRLSHTNGTTKQARNLRTTAGNLRATFSILFHR
jgi:hypothetical protein